jgi:hypothetical protein
MVRRCSVIPAFWPVGKMPTGAGKTPALPFAIRMATPMIHSCPCRPSVFIPRGAPRAAHGDLR